MKFISWNVNGLRACMEKGFKDFFENEAADIFAIQETKMQSGQAEIDMPGYHMYMNSAEKKGYSGTLVYTKQEPINVTYGLKDGKYNDEGRVITLEYDSFFFITAYVPNSQRGLKRLDYRMEFEVDFKNYINELDSIKPVIYCGDLNVAHCPIDLKNPKQNEQNAGYSIEEREKFQELLDSGFSDTYRNLYSDKVEYSWWSYMFNSREKNIGWRIDYFVVSNRLMPEVSDSKIYTKIKGSDHAPIGLAIF